MASVPQLMPLSFVPTTWFGIDQLMPGPTAYG